MSEAADTLRRWRLDPVSFVKENFGVSPDKWQVKALRAIARGGKQRIVLQAAVGVGKSALEAWVGWWFLACLYDPIRHPGKHPNGYALSIDGANLSSGVWKELTLWRSRSPFLMDQFEITSEKAFHKAHPGTWWLKARTFPKSADPEQQGASLAGLHGPYILVLLDEVGTMAVQIGRKAEQALSDAECEVGAILASGNPTTQSGLLYALVSRESVWTVIPVTGDPDDPECSSRVDKEWARGQIKEYGRENPWVMAHILGKFPPGGLNTLLSPDEVRTAMGRNPKEPEFEWAQRRMGIDVARFGDDRTVIFPRQGVVAFIPVILRQQRTDIITAQVLNLKRTFDSELDFIDDTGHWGHGVVDGLLASGQGAQAVMFSDPAIDPRYFNRRAEMWFAMADWIKSRGALPNIPELIPELTQPMYGFRGGKILLEDKGEIKKRLGQSPDLADALALTFAWPDRPGAGSVNHSATTRHAITDYNPHAGLPTG